MKACEDCGEDANRRIRCKSCGLLICSWCFNHVHEMEIHDTGKVSGESRLPRPSDREEGKK